ncbi:prolyl oligopeptidase family serine peptidase [Microvirga tunisiensis]|uniref:Prolyl oligopeptidase family serine peptidase n=1 Tax=Pannonibacter tanglangensis TaxID=2750084 RepID=A0A7X5F303_9HYPH|nr:S9 family peptidase [Pannonibacter sp. XCT-53]NBN78514.1 prolyl oligopeptidase family serine peptidase [Pannonibacter sp. XCT-53]
MTKTVLPPRAEARPLTLTTHGITRQDDYAWLRADNWQEVMRDPSVLAADIRAYLEAENAYLEAQMAPTKALQDTLFAEMKGRIKEDDSSVPMPDGPYEYGLRYVTGGQHPLLTRTPRGGGDEQILVDGDKEAAGKAYFKLAGATHAPDHSRLAWAYDDKGSEFYTLKLRDMATGADMATVIEDTAGGGVFSACGRYLFYIRVDANHRPSKLFRHEIGTDPATDVLVYEEADAGFFMGVGKTQSGSHIVIDIHDHETSEVHVIPADAPTSAPRLIAARQTAVEYSVDESGGRFYILTNADDAEDFKIVTAPVSDPGRANWRDLVPHKGGRLILSVTAYKDFIVRLEREDGLPRIVVRRLVDAVEHAIAFDEEAYSLGLSDGYEFDTSLIRFTYSSMTTPSRTYDYDVETRQRTLRKEQVVPSGHDPANYVTRRLQARAADGELVPVSVLYRKDTPLDGSAPCLLYGYGSYGISIPASFNTNCLSLVDRGFVYAIAHIRGGKEKGYAWYSKGRREFKRNTFTDFLAAADHLVGEGFTAHERIVAQGGSAGGMLMGAVANMGGEKFGGIIAEVPFVDVLNTMLDDTLPLTPPEWPEWGNPIASREAYDYIAGYSPYDNVTAKAYPAILAVGGLTDPRVTYWEPAKWVARLRAVKTGDSLLMLKTNMEAGHGGASGRFDRLKEVALVQAFALKVTGRA